MFENTGSNKPETAIIYSKKGIISTLYKCTMPGSTEVNCTLWARNKKKNFIIPLNLHFLLSHEYGEHGKVVAPLIGAGSMSAGYKL